MDEEAKAVQEAAKATREVAKTTGKALDLVEKSGSFLARVFGDLVDDAVGLVGDQIKYLRLGRFLDFQEKVESRLKQTGRAIVLRSVPPNFALPLIEVATLENNDDLQNLWANLLTSAMDADQPMPRRAFISILKEFEPIDVLLLDYLYRITFQVDSFSEPHRLGSGGFTFPLTELSIHLNMTNEECEISLLNLDQVGCITLVLHRAHTKVDMSYPPLAEVSCHLTGLGKALVESCMK